MAINLSSISNAASAATGLSNLLLVSPNSTQGYQPQNPYNSSGLIQSLNLQQPETILFHYEGEQSAGLTSDITDHYVEDNSAVQDQIALKPVIINTLGYIGELNDVLPPSLQALKTAANALSAVGSYAPQLSVTAQEAYNEAFAAYQIASNLANSAVNAWNTLNKQANPNEDSNVIFSNTQNKQQAMFSKFYGYWTNRTLFTVQTPWALFKDMAIVSLRAVQGADTRVITDFEVSFKQIRNVQSAINSSPSALADRAGSQAASIQNNGTSSGKTVVVDTIGKTVSP